MVLLPLTFALTLLSLLSSFPPLPPIFFPCRSLATDSVLASSWTSGPDDLWAYLKRDSKVLAERIATVGQKAHDQVSQPLVVVRQVVMCGSTGCTGDIWIYREGPPLPGSHRLLRGNNTGLPPNLCETPSSLRFLCRTCVHVEKRLSAGIRKLWLKFTHQSVTRRGCSRRAIMWYVMWQSCDNHLDHNYLITASQQPSKEDSRLIRVSVSLRVVLL